MKKARLFRSFLTSMALVEGCGSGYEVKETNGHTYVQRKSWWKRMAFGLETISSGK